ncbi:MAG: regulating kinase and related kinase [Candidatus Woesearchaeota archaeon]|nr:regulating kinase and related kinase [Candidatus Woesearchaeota archaeon]
MKGSFIGAEALITFEGDIVIKERIEKGYRNKALDKKLRKERTRTEYRILQKLNNAGLHCPKPLEVDEEKAIIKMSRIRGSPLRDIINEKNVESVSTELANIVATMHAMGIVHHDLTTSNFIADRDKIYVIDFGLSFFSDKIEDKAVDIHLLERAIESKHPEIKEAFMNNFFETYLYAYDEGKDVLKRLGKVERRGRYKGKKN